MCLLFIEQMWELDNNDSRDFDYQYRDCFALFFSCFMTHFLARLYSWLTDGLTFDLRILLLREDFIAAPVTSIWPCVVVVKRAQIIKTTVFLKSEVCLDVVFEAQAVFFFFCAGKENNPFLGKLSPKSHAPMVDRYRRCKVLGNHSHEGS